MDVDGTGARMVRGRQGGRSVVGEVGERGRSAHGNLTDCGWVDGRLSKVGAPVSDNAPKQ